MRKQRKVRTGIKWTNLGDLELDRIGFSAFISSAESGAPPARFPPFEWCFDPGEPRDWRCMAIFREREREGGGVLSFFFWLCG